MDEEFVRRFYQNTTLSDCRLWKFQRKHFRAELDNEMFLKLNRRKSRLDAKDLRVICSRLAPKHLYMSVLDYLFPERVASKGRLDTYPIGGELVVDVDSYLYRRPHVDSLDNRLVCEECLEASRQMTLEVGDEIGRYYSRFGVVFSGRRGFHLHVLDFEARDWVKYDPSNPLASHAAARFRFLKLVEPATHVFDRIHFTVSVDPLRVVTVPGSLNCETGLVCTFIGGVGDLESHQVHAILHRSLSERYVFTVAPIPAWEMR